MTMGTLAGSGIPLLMRRLGIDPAHAPAGRCGVRVAVDGHDLDPQLLRQPPDQVGQEDDAASQDGHQNDLALVPELLEIPPDLVGQLHNAARDSIAVDEDLIEIAFHAKSVTATGTPAQRRRIDSPPRTVLLERPLSRRG